MTQVVPVIACERCIAHLSAVTVHTTNTHAASTCVSTTLAVLLSQPQLVAKTSNSKSPVYMIQPVVKPAVKLV